MACSDSISLPGLDTAPVRALQSLLAALTLSDGGGYPGETLAVLLQAIVDGEAPDREPLRETRRGRKHDDNVFYDDGYYEYENRLDNAVEALCRDERDHLVRSCWQQAQRVAERFAYDAFWAHAHACGYYHDPDQTRANAERNAREYVEATWRELRADYASSTAQRSTTAIVCWSSGDGAS